MKRTRLIALISCAVALLAVQSVPAADRPKKVKYVAPEGFAGHKWGELRTGFDRLPAEAMGVGAAWMTPVEKEINFTCIPISGPGPTMGGAGGDCDFQATLLSLHKSFEGGGFYVLSEYEIPEQGFRFGDEAEGVVLHPVVYQFCANWSEVKKEVPPAFDALNKFCGMRLMFQSETRAELRAKPADFVTNYDRMLDKLLAKYGRPEGFLRRGRVVIETLEGDSSDAGDRRFALYRWCPAHGNGLHTSCSASVTLSLDPVTGVGTVLYSTPLLWEFAYARERNKKGDRLYRMLHARK